LIGTSAASVHRYANKQRITPKPIAARLRWLSRVVETLVGTYNEQGIRNCFTRRRQALDGLSPQNRPPSARQQSDERLLPLVRQVYYANLECYGIRKVWQALKHQAVAVGRDQVARLMRAAGLQGKKRQRRVRTTFPNPWAVRSPDLVQRRWNRLAPDRV